MAPYQFALAGWPFMPGKWLFMGPKQHHLHYRIISIGPYMSIMYRYTNMAIKEWSTWNTSSIVYCERAIIVSTFGGLTPDQHTMFF